MMWTPIRPHFHERRRAFLCDLPSRRSRTLMAMTENEAFAASVRLAEHYDVHLGEKFYSRGVGADPNASYWAMLFHAPGCPAGCRWLTNVNDRGEDEVLIALLPDKPKQTLP
jgi:hypothetical protein